MLLEILNRPVRLERPLDAGRQWLMSLFHGPNGWLLPSWLLEDVRQVEIIPSESLYEIRLTKNGDLIEQFHVPALELADRWPSIVPKEWRQSKPPANVILRLPQHTYLAKQFWQPSLAPADLMSAAELQVEVETPFNLRDVYYSAAVLHSDDQESKSLIELVVAPRKPMDRLLEPLVRSGISVDAVSVPDNNGNAAAHNLLPRIRKPALTYPHISLLALVCVFCVEAWFATFLPLYFHERATGELEAQAAAMHEKAAEIETLFLGAKAEATAQRFAVDQRESDPSLLRLLRILTSLAPDDTWLDRLSYRPDQLQISGHAPSTSAFIDILGTDQAFVQPTYTSPVMRDVQLNADRFDLSFKLPVGSGK